MNPKSRCRVAIAAVLLVLLLNIGSCSGRIFSFEMHRRHSKRVRERSGSSTKFPAGSDYPRKGSYEYYAELAARDRMLSGRSLLDMSESPLALADGNSTVRISSLGFLHYTTIKIGKPATKFMVALDTGSDLLWVPCNCTRCAPTQLFHHSPGFGIYDPGRSLTSKGVDCDNPLCSRRDECFAALGRCPYTVSYISANTSSSGFLAEDVLHLTSEDQRDVAAYITFGCSLLQTGSFIETAAPDGLLGLGMEKISVPSILSEKGLISNSFSMCFGRDGSGRINFGDKGSRDQNETPLNTNPSGPRYNVTISQLRVGTALMDLNITSLFDSGTSFTYLTEPAYGSLTESFDSQILDTRRSRDPRIPFEYCYDMGSDASAMPTPHVSLIMKGGYQFALHDPVVIISTRQKRELVYCLAVMKSPDVNVIGQNSMTGYRVVFDRERLILGWKKFNCYEKEQQRPENSFRVRESNSSDLSSGIPKTQTYHEVHVGRVWVVVGLGYLVVVLLVMALSKGQLSVHRYLCRRMPICWRLLL